jgi:hypothetical protein
MQGYMEILTALSGVIPALFVISSAAAKTKTKQNVIVLTSGLRERALRKLALRRAVNPIDRPAA